MTMIVHQLADHHHQTTTNPSRYDWHSRCVRHVMDIESEFWFNLPEGSHNIYLLFSRISTFLQVLLLNTLWRALNLQEIICKLYANDVLTAHPLCTSSRLSILQLIFIPRITNNLIWRRCRYTLLRPRQVEFEIACTCADRLLLLGN